ncbi:MAG: NUDIX hydrolase [Acidobacteria bacterium]|jgi:ADP-ribose pyrophosphatase|nr:MAG: NUDIX hydrolase [Acidobacteriota bacterium]GIU81179.1 MAG: ADP-ribose pyrophosphatase [Pyrinomonadaceae bacterium]
MKPEIIESKLIYQGRVFDVLLSKIRESNVVYEREIVHHNGSAVIVPVFEDMTVTLVRQYRHAAGKYLLEIPAGSIEKGESVEECARRELLEEVGLMANKLEKIAEFFVSPGFLSEKMFVFLATELRQTKQKPEFDEILEVERYDFPTVFEMIKSGKFEDAKTIIGLTLAGIKLGFSFG